MAMIRSTRTHFHYDCSNSWFRVVYFVAVVVAIAVEGCGFTTTSASSMVFVVSRTSCISSRRTRRRNHAGFGGIDDIIGMTTTVSQSDPFVLHAGKTSIGLFLSSSSSSRLSLSSSSSPLDSVIVEGDDNDNVNDNEEQDSNKTQETKTTTKASSSQPGNLAVGTSALLRISYDGSRFTGWSAANTVTSTFNNRNNNKMSPPEGSNKQHNDVTTTNLKTNNTNRQKRRRRRGSLSHSSPSQQQKRGFVRPVEGVIQNNLAKLYGNVNAERVVVEGCSRTDKGVHARELMAQVYCLTQDTYNQLQQQQNKVEDENLATVTNNDTNDSDNNIIYYSIPGKRKPHPISFTDKSYFESLPMGGNLSRIAFALNRMLPADVRVTGIAPTPTIAARTRTNSFENSITNRSLQKGFNNEEEQERQPKLRLDDETQFSNKKSSSTTTTLTTTTTTTASLNLPFHPSIHTHSKTYEYRISVGNFHDPKSWRVVWHIPTNADSTSSNTFNVTAVELACKVLQGTHSFAAFEGAPRSKRDKQKQQQKKQETDTAFAATTAPSTISSYGCCRLSRVTIEELERTRSTANIELPTHFPAFKNGPRIQNYVITVTGDRFLYKMVRFLVGALVAIGTNKLTIADLQHALDTGSWDYNASTTVTNAFSDNACSTITSPTTTITTTSDQSQTKRKEFQCAPAHGLVLSHVNYGSIPIDWQPLQY